MRVELQLQLLGLLGRGALGRGPLGLGLPGGSLQGLIGLGLLILLLLLFRSVPGRDDNVNSNTTPRLSLEAPRKPLDPSRVTS